MLNISHSYNIITLINKINLVAKTHSVLLNMFSAARKNIKRRYAFKIMIKKK